MKRKYCTTIIKRNKEDLFTTDAWVGRPELSITFRMLTSNYSLTMKTKTQMNYKQEKWRVHSTKEGRKHKNITNRQFDDYTSR